MTRYNLNIPGFIDPRWWNKVCGKKYEAKTQKLLHAESGIIIEGKQLTFSGQPITAGKDVIVWMAGNPYCFLAAEYEAEQKRIHERKQAEKEAEAARKNLLRDQAKKFNTSLNVPVSWSPGIKEVLSGLSANSWGDGRRKNTVQHVWLKDDLVSGRLKRRKGDFLCSQSKSRWGANWSEQIEEFSYDGSGQPYPAKVTCKRCIEICERFK